MSVIEDIDRLFQDAVHHIQRGLYRESIDLLNKIISLKPSSGVGIFYYNIGCSYIYLNDIEQALSALTNAILADPTIYSAYHTIHDLFAGFDVQSKIICYKQILKVVPDFIDVGPRRIRIETSSACNLRCKHCPTGTSYHDADRSILSLEDFDTIVKQIKDIPTLSSAVLYLGGEPLLNKNIITICKRIKDETTILDTHLNTNGMLLSRELCAQIDDAKLDFIEISIDGKTPEENNHIRTGSDYNTIVNNINMLRGLSNKTTIHIANTQIKNWDDPDTAVVPDFLKKDFDGIFVNCNYAIKWPSFLIDKESNMVCVKNNYTTNFCQHPFDSISVKSNGDVTMCCYDLLGKEVIGNVFKTHMKQIWASAKYNKIRKAILNNKYKQLPKICQICPQYTGNKIYLSSDV